MNCSETGNQIQNNQEKYWHTKSNKNWAITVKTQKSFINLNFDQNSSVSTAQLHAYHHAQIWLKNVLQKH